MLRLFAGLFVVAATWTLEPAQDASAQNLLRLENLDRFIPVWRYPDGDDSLFADPDYPDSDWEPVVQTEFWDDRMPERGWPGIGWFRAEIDVETEAVGVPIGFAPAVKGAAELYVDGRFSRFRFCSNEQTPRAKGFGDSGCHLPTRSSRISLSQESNETDLAYSARLAPDGSAN